MAVSRCPLARKPHADAWGTEGRTISGRRLAVAARPRRLRQRYRAKSAITPGAAASKPTTSSIPASPGSAIEKPLEIIPTTASLAGIPVSRR